MRRILPEDRFAGEVLAEAVVGEDGQMLCRPGTRLSQGLLGRLRSRGIDVIYIEAAGFEGIDARESVDWPTRASLQRLFATARAQAADGEGPHDLDDVPVRALRERILEATSAEAPCLLLPKRGLVYGADGTVALDPSRDDGLGRTDMAECLTVHAINTALIVASAGRMLRLRAADLPSLVDAALIHDIGMFVVPEAAWFRTGPLEAAEQEKLRRHPESSLEAFAGSLHWDTYMRLSVLQHHERLDGSGYPQGLAGDRLLPSSLLLAAADMYAALVEPRPHRAAWRPEDVLEMQLAVAGVELPADVVRAVGSALGPYPRGATVLLSDGRRGIVTRSGQGTHVRPTLRVDGADLDLNASLGLMIAGIVD